MRNKITLTVSAMMLAAQLGSPLAPRAATLEQLTTIAALLSSNDVAGLRAFIDANPDLLAEETQLALLLRRFMIESADPMAYLAFDPTLQELFDSLAGGASSDMVAGVGPVGEEEIVEEGSDPGDDDDEDGVGGGSGPGGGSGGDGGSGTGGGGTGGGTTNPGGGGQPIY